MENLSIQFFFGWLSLFIMLAVVLFRLRTLVSLLFRLVSACDRLAENNFVLSELMGQIVKKL